MKTFELDSIGTHLSLQVDTSHDYEILFTNIRDRLVCFEKKFSRFKSENWLSDLNMARQATLDDDARFMLTFALDVAQKTHGYFDPTIGKRLTELGYGNKENIPEIPQKKEFGDYRDIEMIGDQVILHGDILLEFGGVGKGYLIDVIEEMMTDFFDIGPKYLINFGGDMYGSGEWNVALESPFSLDEALGTLVLKNNYLACSAPTRRKWAGGHHLIDPKTGSPTTEIVATFIEGSSGILTDSYATALSVMPWKQACETLQNTSHIEGVLVRSDGVFFQSENSQIQLFT